MPRTPPSSSGRYANHAPIPVYAFEKSTGSSSSTFVVRVVHRVPIRLSLRSGSTIDAVRYAGRYWPIYKPETFAENARQWVGERDTLYGPDNSPLRLPLEHAYLFDCDAPKGSYGW